MAQTPEVAVAHRFGCSDGSYKHMLVRLKPRNQRSRSAEEIIADMRPKLIEVAPLAEIEFVQLLQDMLGDLEGNPTPIDVKIFGDDPEKLAELAEPVEIMLGEVSGVVDVVGMQKGNPEVTWNIDPVATARLGLTVIESAHRIQLATSTEPLPDRQCPVREALPDAFRLIRKLTRSFAPARHGGDAASPADALNGQSAASREPPQHGRVTAGWCDPAHLPSPHCIFAGLSSRLRGS